VSAARIIDVPPDDYHKLPGLSSSIATTLIQRSPMHAHVEKEPTKEMDRGAAIHHLVLGAGKRMAPLPFDNWRTKAAQESREKARAAGMVPLTHVEHTEYTTAAERISERLREAGIELSGRSEVAIEWYEGDVQCRCMMDHVDLERGEVTELKVTGDANPERMERHVETMGYRIQAAAYIRALIALRPTLMGRVSYRFAFAEPDPPYALYAPYPDAMFLESGERDWLRAVEMWRSCMRNNRWPHYQHHQSISRPQWALRREGYTNDE